MWDDYEVVVATHQNTNYIHNHFIINSVSYKTGKKYNNKATYARLRHISDALCQEYGLSTLEEDTRYQNSYKNKWQDNDYYKIAKEDIGTIISESISSKQFLTKLKQLGYKYYIKYGKLTIYKEEQDKIRIEKRSIDIQNNIDNFDKDIGISNEKDNIRVMWTTPILSFFIFINS